MSSQEEVNNNLFGAVANWDHSATKEAIEKYGADVNHYNETNKLRPLIMAALNKSPKIVKILLDAGADPTLTADEGYDALFVAQFDADHESIELLEEAIKLKNIRDRAKKINAKFNEEKKLNPNSPFSNVIKIF